MANTVLKQMKDKMEQAVQSFSKNLASVRAGRANPSLLDSVYVDYYGASTPLNQLASVGAPEARMLVITPYDKTALGEIEKAIQKANLGLSPTNDGNIVRISIPALNEQRRKDLMKVVGKFAEESRIQIRNIRRDANDQLKALEKDSTITEDELRKFTDIVQKDTDNFIAKIEKTVDKKEIEIMEV